MSDTLEATGQKSLSLSRYVSDMLAAIVICLCEDIRQIHWLSQVSVIWRYVSDKLDAIDHRSLSLSRYASDTLAVTGFCLYGGMCQIRWLPQVSASMEAWVRYAGCHIPHVSVSMEVCVRHADCHRYVSMEVCVRLYSEGWCHICSVL